MPRERQTPIAIGDHDTQRQTWAKRVKRSAALLAVLALLGCGPIEPRRPHRVQRFTFSHDSVTKIAEATAHARGLSLKRKVNIVRVDRSRFLELIRERNERLYSQNEQQQGQWVPRLLAFGLLPKPDVLEKATSMNELREGAIGGFYNAKVDTIFIPRVTFVDRRGEKARRATLAHEAHHALQYQHFDIKGMPVDDHADARLAAIAVVEGDAKVAESAYLAAEYARPIGRGIRLAAEAVARTTLSEREWRKTNFAHALPLAREVMLFPYRAGAIFVADIYRAGGFDLVNSLYGRPPVSTSQVLHADRYLAGIQPARITLPGGPSGDEGRLGELKVRVMLSRCHGVAAATKVASGWRGDAYRVWSRSGGEVALEWLVVFDSVEDARVFESAVRKPSCWFANDVEQLSIAPGAAVKRDETRVALVRGMGVQSAARLDALLAAEVRLPPAVPIGNYRLKPRPSLDEAGPGVVQKNVYRSRWLGVEAALPPGLQHSIATYPRAELTVQGPHRSIAGLSVSDRMARPGHLERVYEDVLDAVRWSIGRLHVGKPTDMTGQGTLGPLSIRMWRFNTQATVRAVVVPICEGAGSLLFVQVFYDDVGKRAMDAWLNAFRWTGDRTKLPVCELLRPG